MLIQNSSVYHTPNYSPSYLNTTPAFKGCVPKPSITKTCNTGIRSINIQKVKAILRKIISKYVSSKKTSNNATRAKIYEIYPKKQKFNFFSKIKKYMQNLKVDENIDPTKIEELLLKAGAKDVTTIEGIKFEPTAEYPLGKKKKFILNDKSYILETHNGNNSMDTVTRFYEVGPKNERKYLTRNGAFQSDSYYSAFTHLSSGITGSKWINLTA